MSAIYSKLTNIQARLKAPKSQYNNFGKYAYRSCEDIVESAKPLLNEQGLALIMSDDVVLIGELPKVSGAVGKYLIWGSNQAESGVLHSSVGNVKFPSAATENAYGAEISISFGNNQRHNNISPGIAVYGWHRIS